MNSANLCSAWHLETIDSPLGPVSLLLSPEESGGLTALHFGDGESLRQRHTLRHPTGTILEVSGHRITAQLREYFAGSVRAIDALATEAPGTPFQQMVWRELRRIPVGEVISYGELARRIGQPTAVRAVALANARNPIAIVVPCHRVIAADGSLHGYAGGIERKQWLLEHEARSTGRGAPAVRGLGSPRLFGLD